VDVRLNEEIGEALGGRNGRLRAIRLKNSSHEIECQLVGAAIGIRPNIDFLEGSEIDVAIDPKRGTPQGIKVDESMRTNIPNVYAAGDVIHRTLGLWEPARLQGRVAGRNMAGGTEVLPRSVHYNATRLYDLDFAGVGHPVEKPGDQVLIDFPRGSGRVAYRKLIIREGKLVGAIMLGQRKEHVRKYGMQYRKLIENKTDISSISEILLDPSFDLASWLESHSIGDQIDSVRKMRESHHTPSIAEMRQTRHELSKGTLRSTHATAMIKDPMLLQGERKIPLKNVTRIGRKPNNDLVLSDPDVSGLHAQIRWEGSTFLLEDLQSTNGTFLNGQRINSPVQLGDGALINVGKTQIQFVSGTASPAENLRMTSVGLPEAPPPPSALPSDPVWGTLQFDGRMIPLQMFAANIGRDAKADIALEDPTISYIHAQLVRQGNDAYLRDLGSRNGTFVNGARISMPHRLAHGDVIKLGETTLVFRSGSVPLPEVTVTERTPIESPTEEETIVYKEDPVATAAPPQPVPVAEITFATRRQLMLTLTVRSGDLSGTSFQLNQSPMTLGRNPESHIVISHVTTSWNHAVFKQEDMKWFVRDVGSSNGTHLNEKRLEPNQPHPIQVGDQLKFGETLLEVTQDAG
jgi:pSer/pThr/pTyr-binding forkhead associated (FHA) protein